MGDESRNVRLQETQPFWERRPSSLSRLIEARFEELRHQPVVDGHIKEYSSEDEVNYLYSYGVNAEAFLSGYLSNRSGSIDVLDIGSGNGMFLEYIKAKFGDRIRAHGISAHAYKKGKSASVDYHIADAERLSACYPANSMEVIVSHRCVTHLIDPLGAINQIYEVLKPGGVAVIDEFSLEGLEGRLGSLIDYWKRKGYFVLPDYKYTVNDAGKISSRRFYSLVIRKNELEHLDIPVQYDGIVSRFGKSRARYNFELSGASEGHIELPQTLVRLAGQYFELIEKYESYRIHFEDLFRMEDARDVPGFWRADLGEIEPKDRDTMVEISKLFPQILLEWQEIRQSYLAQLSFVVGFSIKKNR